MMRNNNATTLPVTADTVTDILKSARGTTFASIRYATDVPVSAKNKSKTVRKMTVANVQLFNNLNDFTNVYENAVKRSATKIGGNATENVENFASQGNYFEHTDCYSVVRNKKNGKKYLFAIFNNAKSSYFVNDKEASKEEVATLLTPSAASKLLSDDNTVHNVSNNVVHGVHVRTISLDNILSINTQNQKIGD